MYGVVKSWKTIIIVNPMEMLVVHNYHATRIFQLMKKIKATCTVLLLTISFHSKEVCFASWSELRSIDEKIERF